MISFRDITEDNFDAVIRMKRPDDEGFVCSNAKSLAQCYLYRDNGDVFPYAIYWDETPVGFLLLEEDMDENALILWRIMFPPQNEGKGYGTKAVQMVIDNARASGKYDVLLLDCDDRNAKARHIYEKLGFTPTGKHEDNNTEFRYLLK